MATNTELIRVVDVMKEYNNGAVKALNGCNLSVARGEVIAIIGPSGSGKSTMMNIIGCMDKPTSGEVLLDGTDIAKESAKNLTVIRRDKIGLIFQQFHLVNYLTAVENVMVSQYYHSLPDEEDGWEYVTRYHARRPHGKVIMQSGNRNGIAIMDSEGNDVALDVLGDSRRTVLLLFPDLPQVGVVNSFALNELNDAALVADAAVVGLTPASADEVAQWQDISMASYPIYNMDDSELKMVARGNPAVVYLENGTIKWKRTLQSLSSVEEPIELSEMAGDHDPDAVMTNLMLVYLAAMAALLLINRTHVMVRYLHRKHHSKTTTTGN